MAASSIDRYSVHAAWLSAPAEDLFSVTPDDDNDLSKETRAIYVGVGGDLKVTTRAGSTVTIVNAEAGWHPIRLTRIHSTGTTATDILGAV